MKRRYDWITQQTQKTGAPNGKFGGKGLKPTTTSVKLSEAILSIFGDCWEKCIRSSPPERLMEEFPTSKVQPTTYNLQPDLLGSFAEDVYVQTLNYGPLWVWPKGKIQTFSWGVVGGGGLGCSVWHITHIVAILDIKYYFFHISQPAKFASRTNILRNRSIGFPLKRGHGWTDLKGIKTDCNCAFQSSFLLFVKFDITLGKH